MGIFDLSGQERQLVTDMLLEEARTAAGKKALEFGCGRFTAAAELCQELEYLGITDKSADALNTFRGKAEDSGIHLIPDAELGEDCYFGRFHMIYTVFGFRDLPHLVDEIMRLRRLILKGGKMVIIDRDADSFEANYIKQLKRCGFEKIRTGFLSPDDHAFFIISAEK